MSSDLRASIKTITDHIDDPALKFLTDGLLFMKKWPASVLLFSQNKDKIEKFAQLTVGDVKKVWSSDRSCDEYELDKILHLKDTDSYKIPSSVPSKPIEKEIKEETKASRKDAETTLYHSYTLQDLNTGSISHVQLPVSQKKGIKYDEKGYMLSLFVESQLNPFTFFGRLDVSNRRKITRQVCLADDEKMLTCIEFFYLVRSSTSIGWFYDLFEGESFTRAKTANGQDNLSYHFPVQFFFALSIAEQEKVIAWYNKANLNLD